MSNFPLFSKNGSLLTSEHELISLNNIEYSYGYGVYETLKVRNNILYFVDQHLDRLEHSASVLEISLPFTKSDIKAFLQALVEALHVDACNIKILLIGGEKPDIYIFATAPLFPDRKLYREGASLLSYNYERLFPTAKTLNMLASYMAYKKAKEHNCYDALLISRKGYILEGTRTNFCLIKDHTIFQAPSDSILAGVTFLTLAKTAKKIGLTIVEKNISLTDLIKYDGAFITSTSTKIMPVKKIDSLVLPMIPDTVRSLMKAYDEFLDSSKGIL